VRKLHGSDPRRVVGFSQQHLDLEHEDSGRVLPLAPRSGILSLRIANCNTQNQEALDDAEALLRRLRLPTLAVRRTARLRRKLCRRRRPTA
jgi:hypothetical protein